MLRAFFLRTIMWTGDTLQLRRRGYVFADKDTNLCVPRIHALGHDRETALAEGN